MRRSLRTAAEAGTEFNQRSIILPNKLDSWAKVSENLRKMVQGEVRDVEGFERVYTSIESFRPEPKFAGLRRVLRDGRHVSERHFLDTLLPWIASKALEVERLFRDQNYQLPLLVQGTEGEVVLTRLQASCLLALAFFCTFPPPSDRHFQHFLLTHFLCSDSQSQRSKLLCVLAYFDRVREAEMERRRDFLDLKISVERRGIEKQDPEVFWGKCDRPLSQFSCEEEGLIEDAHGDLQVDFANRYIGGGVLEMGNVQEEIRFSINPECLVSMLICEVMLDNEAILIRGAEQFAEYSGYGSGFLFTGPHTDSNPTDKRNVRCVSIVAIDAEPQGYADQDEYDAATLVRELDKAYCGFSFVIAGDDRGSGAMRPVATGNWGCGAFGGDRELKTLQQWMAATMAGRPIKYYSFRDNSFSDRQGKIVSLLREREVTVGQLYQILVSYSKLTERCGVFNFVAEKLAAS
jgi:poly(ADP-ribose) glycohydrolase